MSLPTARLAAGRYDVVLRDAATGATLARSPIWVYERGSRATMSTDARTYRPGERIRVSWHGAPGEHLDWIGLYRCRRTCDDPGGYLAYRYTHTRIEGSLVLGRHRGPGRGRAAVAAAARRVRRPAARRRQLPGGRRDTPVPRPRPLEPRVARALMDGASVDSWSVRLAADPGGVPGARRFVVEGVSAWGFDPLAESAELVVSELAGNAALHSGARFMYVT